MQDIYKYTPETNHICIVYIVALFLKSHFPLHVMLIPKLNVLYLYTSSPQYVCAVPNMAVACSFIIIIITIIIIIICYHLYTHHLQWCTWNKPC
jgi:hypothetical protein